MNDAVKTAGAGRGSVWRKLGWGTAALILLLPFVAMQVTREVQWDAADFLLIGATLLFASLWALSAGLFRTAGARG